MSLEFRDSLHASVPAHELEHANRFLRDGVVVSRPPDEELAAAHPSTRVLSVSSQDRLGVDTLAAFVHLEAVVTRSTGCDRLPLDEMRERGIQAYHLNGYATESVAQHTLMFLLMLLRRAPEAMDSTAGRTGGSSGGHAPSWDRSGLQGRNLKDVMIGVLGTGRIGTRMVRLLTGMGARVRGFDIAPNPLLLDVPGFRYASSLDDLLAVSQVLTLHVPLTRHTNGMIDEAALARLPKGAVLVNTARGAVVDQDAVARALEDGRLRGYAADVLPGEPDPPDLVRFKDRSNVILTPHLAAYDDQALQARYATTARLAQAVLQGAQDEWVGQFATRA